MISTSSASNFGPTRTRNVSRTVSICMCLSRDPYETILIVALIRGLLTHTASRGRNGRNLTNGYFARTTWVAWLVDACSVHL